MKTGKLTEIKFTLIELLIKTTCQIYLYAVY